MRLFSEIEVNAGHSIIALGHIVCLDVSSVPHQPLSKRWNVSTDHGLRQGSVQLQAQQ